MQVKSFRGPNATAVMQKIKAELGPDAIILSTRNFREGGARCCEVTAALEHGSAPASADSDAAGNAAPDAPQAVRQGAALPRAQAAPIAADHTPMDAAAPGWAEWHTEWSSIKSHILAFMKPHMDLGALSPRQRLALEYLEREGVEGDVSLRLFETLRRDGTASVLAPLGKIVTVKEWTPSRWPEKFHALTGPSGAGKTSALVRMALLFRRMHKKRKICLVNADPRSSGRYLLSHYADLLDMAFMQATNEEEFAEVVVASEKYDTVFIDLPGLARGETLADLEKLLGMRRAKDLKVHLALAPYYSPAQFAAFRRQYYTPRAGSLVWTKLDEADSYGALINGAAATGLPASALSFGPGLKDTMAPAGADTLWRVVFKHQLPGIANGAKAA